MENKHLTIFFTILSFGFTIFFLSLALASKPLQECSPGDAMFRESPGLNVKMGDDTNSEIPTVETKPRNECARWEKTCEAWKTNYKNWKAIYDNKKPDNLQRNVIIRMNTYAQHYNENCPKDCPGYGKLPIKPLPK